MNSRTGLPVLMYHTVDPRPSVVAIPPAQFCWQMEWLCQSGYRCISMGEICRLLEARQDFPERTIALTFDDGYQSLYREVFPILNRYGFSATVFLVAAYCGKDNQWVGQPAGIPKMDLLSWVQIDEMARHGIEFGSHTLHHPRLDLANIDGLHAEIVDSKTVLEDQLGIPVTAFAYPYGRYNGVVKEMVQSVYEGACNTRVGLAKPDSDRFELERIEIKYLSNPWVFRHLFHSTFPYYLLLRRVGRKVRSALFSQAWE